MPDFTNILTGIGILVGIWIAIAIINRQTLTDYDKDWHDRINDL